MGSQVRALLFPPYMARWCSRLARQPVTLEVDGSSPFRVAIFLTHLWCVGEEIFSSFASVAQLVEQWTENPRVVGSTPTGGTICGCSSSGRAPPCQGGGSEFEPRHPLQNGSIRNALAFLIFSEFHMVTWPSGKAKVCKTFIPRFKSGRHLQKRHPS